MKLIILFLIYKLLIINNSESLYLFGKVQKQDILAKTNNRNNNATHNSVNNANDRYASCCCEVKETWSYLYFIPKERVFIDYSEEIQRL